MLRDVSITVDDEQVRIALAHTHAHTHTHVRTRTHTRAHTHTQARTHSCAHTALVPCCRNSSRPGSTWTWWTTRPRLPRCPGMRGCVEGEPRTREGLGFHESNSQGFACRLVFKPDCFEQCPRLGIAAGAGVRCGVTVALRVQGISEAALLHRLTWHTHVSARTQCDRLLQAGDPGPRCSHQSNCCALALCCAQENQCSIDPMLGVLYFCIYMLVCVFIMLQLVIGVIVDNIEEAENQEQMAITQVCVPCTYMYGFGCGSGLAVIGLSGGLHACNSTGCRFGLDGWVGEIRVDLGVGGWVCECANVHVRARVWVLAPAALPHMQCIGCAPQPMLCSDLHGHPLPTVLLFPPLVHALLPSSPTSIPALLTHFAPLSSPSPFCPTLALSPSHAHLAVCPLVPLPTLPCCPTAQLVRAVSRLPCEQHTRNQNEHALGGWGRQHKSAQCAFCSWRYALCLCVPCRRMTCWTTCACGRGWTLTVPATSTSRN